MDVGEAEGSAEEEEAEEEEAAEAAGDDDDDDGDDDDDDDDDVFVCLVLNNECADVSILTKTSNNDNLNKYDFHDIYDLFICIYII